LFDMNKVFEDFVVTALREALHLKQREFPPGTHGWRLRLDVLGQVRLKPDLSWWHNKQCLFVGDVKYKRVTVDGIDHPDLYQLLAYTIATGLRHGLLVYAAGEATDISHKIPGAEKELSVRTLDLSGTPSDILQQVRRLAALVRSLSGTGQKIGVPVHWGDWTC
jgi:5-methylcytosine-specific restriction enzyme subunit McrC